METENPIIDQYLEYISNKEFPCVAAKAALAREQIQCLVASNLMCPKDDLKILEFLYGFVERYRSSKDLYHTAAIIFKGPFEMNEQLFDNFLWKRLQAISDLDAERYEYDTRVDSDPASNDFSFSLKGEAFFIIGLHPQNSRISRQFQYPTLVFNPHSQFQRLKESEKYDNLKKVVRKRDFAYSGSINPMLEDFGNLSEVYQYTGKVYDNKWKCPLKIHHGNEHNSAA